MIPALPYGALALLAVASTLVSSEDRRPAFFASVAIFVGWVLFNSAWWGTSPAGLLNDAGIGVSHADVWSITDLAIGAIILYTGQCRWWSLSLWALLTAQVLLHCFYQFAGLAFASYSFALDVLFLGQLAVLFMIGGRSIVDHLLNLVHHVRDVLLPTAPASGETEAGRASWKK